MSNIHTLTGPNSSQMDVQIYVYDLSKGMAAAMSQQFLGTHIEGIWHTAVVVYGKEYFFGGGIQATLPGQSAAGRPDKVVSVGRTEVPEWMFAQFIDGVRGKFTQETYHLLTNNCNHFTDEAATFLTGTGAPDYVIGLPAAFASSPMGAMLTPMIDTFYKSMGGAAAPVGASQQQPPMAGTGGGGPGGSTRTGAGPGSGGTGSTGGGGAFGGAGNTLGSGASDGGMPLD